MARGVVVLDNRALDVLCYEPTHTFVEKLQTISTKYRTLPTTGELPNNFLRHYYDVYCLLGMDEVQVFMRSEGYQIRKQQRFRTGDELVIAHNPAFTLTDPVQRHVFKRAYQVSEALYYQGQPEFDELLQRIYENLPVM